MLGSTGSIGTQTLEVVRTYPDIFEISVLTGNRNVDLLISQALEFKPNVVVVVDEEGYEKVNEALFSEGIKVYTGEEALAAVTEMD